MTDTDKKTKKAGKGLKKAAIPIKDLAPLGDPKGGQSKTSLNAAEPRGGWDGNHNLAAV